MEYLDGKPLDKLIRHQGRLSVNNTLHIMIQVCSSLHEAHQKGIIHRDLKPDNIFVCNVGGDPNFAKVLDFGVAKLKQTDKAQGTLTQAGMIFGTPKYMSPEQSRSTNLDPRSDIYALGVIMYEMLTGQVPFDAESPLSILIQHVQNRPATFAEIAPDLIVPMEVEAIIRKALSKRPDDRQQSSEDLKKELDACYQVFKTLHEFDMVLTQGNINQLDIPQDRRDALTNPGAYAKSISDHGGSTFVPIFQSEIVTESGMPSDAVTQGHLETAVAMGLESPTIHHAPLEVRRTSTGKKVLMTIILSLLLILGGGTFFYLKIDKLPDTIQKFFPAQIYEASATIPEWEPIEVTIATNPQNIKLEVLQVVKKGDQLTKESVGHTPLTLKKLNGTAIQYAFNLDDKEYELPQDETLHFDHNHIKTINLVKVKKDAPLKNSGQAVVIESISDVKKTTQNKKIVSKTEEKPIKKEEKKEDQTHQKIIDLKNPYGP
jgi:serine/threonine protein kinase